MKFSFLVLNLIITSAFILPLFTVYAGTGTPDPWVEAGFDQSLGSYLPLDISFQDEQGKRVVMGDYFNTRPVVLVFAYYDCPMLCSLVLADLTRSLAALEFNPGNEFEVLTVSIDPGDTPELAAVKKAALLSEFGRPDAENGWHFLTGEKESIDALAGAVGFRYFYDDVQDEYAHPAGLVLLTPAGQISRYYFGLNYSPNDLRLGLVEASLSRIGNWIDQAYLLCYEYNPETGTYGLVLSRVLRLAGMATVVGLGGLVGILVLKERTHG